MAENKEEVLPHGDYLMPDGRIHHVLEVQNGTIDLWNYLKKKLDPIIEKKVKEINDVGDKMGE